MNTLQHSLMKYFLHHSNHWPKFVQWQTQFTTFLSEFRTKLEYDKNHSTCLEQQQRQQQNTKLIQWHHRGTRGSQNGSGWKEQQWILCSHLPAPASDTKIRSWLWGGSFFCTKRWKGSLGGKNHTSKYSIIPATLMIFHILWFISLTSSQPKVKS